MAVLDMHEQEQIDALKAWWKENGKWVVIAVVLAACVFAGTVFWKRWHAEQNAEALAMYAEVIKQLGGNDPKRVNEAVAAMTTKYASSAYAARAELLAAQVNVQAKDVGKAVGQLQWVVDHASEDGLRNVARLKLASLWLDEKKYDDALKALDAPYSDAYAGLFLDLKGDILNAQGKRDEARAAYTQALAKTDTASMYHTLVQLKLEGLGGAK